MRPYPPKHGSGSVFRGERQRRFRSGSDRANFRSARVIRQRHRRNSETGDVDGGPPAVANTFSLQLNSNFFSNSPSCDGAATPTNCTGLGAVRLLEFRLLDHAILADQLQQHVSRGLVRLFSDCYTNGTNSASIPSQTIANLGNLSLMGEAISGGMDTVVLSTGTTLYAAQNPDSAVYLAQGWTAAEFNIFGDCCGTRPIFNNGASVVVRTSVNNGSSSAAQCLAGGFTGETNNLYFNPAAEHSNLRGVVGGCVQQSSASSSTSPCTYTSDLAANKAATHDFNGNGYSDILWRDDRWRCGDLAHERCSGLEPSPDFSNVGTSWTIAGTERL